MKTIVRKAIIGMMIFILIHLLFVEEVYSQSGKWTRKAKFEYGLQVNQILNGCGHGMITDLDMAFRFQRNTINVGAFMQSKYQKFAGLSLQYKNTLTIDDYCNLYVHYSFMYHRQNFLNNNLNELYHPENYNRSAEYEKFNTFAQYIGIGVETVTVHNLYLDVKVGIGGYFSNVVGEDTRNTSVIGRDDASLAFMTSVGISYFIQSRGKIRKFRYL